MTDEQRAHDFALAAMRLYFENNSEMFLSKNGDESVLDIRKLFETYDQFYMITIQEYMKPAVKD